MTQLCGTRGYADTFLDTAHKNLQVQSLFRCELPYGLAAGGQIAWTGFAADVSADPILLPQCAIWITPPVGSQTRQYLTFGGLSAVGISAGGLVKCDALPAMLPGTRLQVVTWYLNFALLGGDGLPTRQYLWTKESSAGAEDFDGLLAGASLTNAALLGGGFKHDGSTFPTGALYQPAWGPAWVEGIPHSSYVGPTDTVLVWTDSIGAGFFDLGSDNSTWSCRCFQGRALKDRVPYVTWGRGGVGHNFMFSQDGNTVFNALIPLCKVAVNEIIINDIRTHTPTNTIAAYIQTLRTSGAAFMKLNGLNTVQTTIDPCEQVFTAWTPSDGGGANDINYATFVAQRALGNQWVRNHSNPIDTPGMICYFEMDKTLGTATDTAQYNPLYRTDGIHPNEAGHDKVASVFTYSACMPPSNNRGYQSPFRSVEFPFL